MNLDELMNKFPPETLVVRKSDRVQNPKPLSWCRNLKLWATEEARNIGHIIPQFMIDDANADDWQLFHSSN